MDDLSAQSWEQRYLDGQNPWDLGYPTPPLVNLLASTQAPPPGRMAVLGCGSGHDALFFASQGFDVVGFDFAPSAIERAQVAAQARGLNAQFLVRDIFALEPKFHHNFDYVLEHTCFCAIDPGLRSQYPPLIQTLLRPQGQLIALFFTHNRPGGPPFGSKPQAILDLFTPSFRVVLFQQAQDSIPRRQNEEHLAIFQNS
jgi:methyl halide transferase